MKVKIFRLEYLLRRPFCLPLDSAAWDGHTTRLCP